MNNTGKLLLKCIDCYVNNKKLNIEIDFDENTESVTTRQIQHIYEN